MRGGPSPWIDDLDDDADEQSHGPNSPRRLLITALAAVPWIVVTALLVLPGRLGGVNGPPAAAPSLTGGDPGPTTSTPGAKQDAGDADDPAPVADRPGGTPDAGAEVVAEDPRSSAVPPEAVRDDVRQPLLDLVELRGRWRPVAGPEEAAALAVVVARAWLTGVEPVLELDGVEPVLPDGYAEHLVVEAVERPAPEAAVVTLLAVVLHDEPELRSQVRRLAVPIAWEHDGPRPAGEPWWLPGPELEPRVPDAEPVDDPAEQLLAVEALTRAGYEDVELRSLGRSSGWPVIADVTARTPDGAAVDGRVWLRHHQGRLVVAGPPVSVSQPPRQPVRHPQEAESPASDTPEEAGS